MLAAGSLVAMTTLTLTWAEVEPPMRYRQTVWGELARLPASLTGSRLYETLTKNVLVSLGPNRLVCAALVATAATAALAIGAADARRR